MELCPRALEVLKRHLTLRARLKLAGKIDHDDLFFKETGEPIRNLHALPDSISESVLAFIFLYFTTVVTRTFALLISGLDFVTAFSAIIACINDAGPGLNQVGPAGNYAGLTDFQTWTCTLAMLAGRIEIFTLLVLFTAAFWRK